MEMWALATPQNPTVFTHWGPETQRGGTSSACGCGVSSSLELRKRKNKSRGNQKRCTKSDFSSTDSPSRKSHGFMKASMDPALGICMEVAYLLYP